MNVGNVYPTNLYGDVEITEYRNSREVYVRFLITGNIGVVQKDALLKGYVQDIQERTRLIQAKEKAARDAMNAKRVEQQRIASEKIDTAKLVAAGKIESDLQRKLSVLQMSKDGMLLAGQVFKDTYGLEYEVLERALVDGKIPQLWPVRYKASGNTYQSTELALLNGRCKDTSNPFISSIVSEYARKKSSDWYEKHRDERRAYAIQYQKDNLEKTRLRNSARKSKSTIGKCATRLQKQCLLQAQKYKCTSCSATITGTNRDAHVDHIMPLALGGSNDLANLQWLCQPCSSMKSDKHPDAWEVYIKTEDFAYRRANR